MINANEGQKKLHFAELINTNESFYLHFAESIIAIDGFLILFHQRKISVKMLQFHQKYYV